MESLVHSTCPLEDGASLAYEVYGDNIKALPLILVGGLSNIRGDWQRLSLPLAKTRPVVVYDHRGIGDSQFSSPDGSDDISIESMTRDLKALMNHLGYEQVAICGFSMGGVIAQQMLFLPYHPTQPTDLGFEVTHVLVTASMTSVLRDPNYGPPIGPDFAKKTEEEKARVLVTSMLDPVWIANPDNSERFEEWVQRYLVKRPSSTIAKQLQATDNYDFSPYYERLSDSKTRVLVLHGKSDSVLPFSGQEEILSRYPLARAVEVGPNPGQVPDLAFGHAWFEYFDAEVWVNVIETFLNEKHGGEASTKL